MRTSLLWRKPHINASFSFPTSINPHCSFLLGQYIFVDNHTNIKRLTSLQGCRNYGVRLFAFLCASGERVERPRGVDYQRGPSSRPTLSPSIRGQRRLPRRVQVSHSVRKHRTISVLHTIQCHLACVVPSLACLSFLSLVLWPRKGIGFVERQTTSGIAPQNCPHQHSDDIQHSPFPLIFQTVLSRKCTDRLLIPAWPCASRPFFRKYFGVAHLTYWPFFSY